MNQTAHSKSTRQIQDGYTKTSDLIFKKSLNTYKSFYLLKKALQVTERRDFSQPVVLENAGFEACFRQKYGDINLPESRVVFTIAATFQEMYLKDVYLTDVFLRDE